MGKKDKAAAEAALLALRSPAPTADVVRDELTILWDGPSPLSLDAVRAACDLGKNLDQIGILSGHADSFVLKYNSIIMRAPGKGPLVGASEGANWHATPMQKIIAEVHARAQP